MARGGKRKWMAKRRMVRSRSSWQREDIGPTPEVFARKADALGVDLEKIVDIKTRQSILQQDASTPLAVLHARGLLSLDGYTGQELREAGEDYARLYWHHIGTPWPSVGFYGERVSEGSVRSAHDEDPEAEIRREARFNRMHERLGRQGRKVKEATDAVCVDGDWPVIMANGERVVYGDFALCHHPLSLVLEGLRALVDLRRGK